MHDSNSTPPVKIGIGRMIFLGILMIFAVLAVWNLLWRTANNRAVARLETAARQRGEPVTVRELAAAYPKVPDEENIHRALMKLWTSEDAPPSQAPRDNPDGARWYRARGEHR